MNQEGFFPSQSGNAGDSKSAIRHEVTAVNLKTMIILCSGIHARQPSCDLQICPKQIGIYPVWYPAATKVWYSVLIRIPNSQAENQLALDPSTPPPSQYASHTYPSIHNRDPINPIFLPFPPINNQKKEKISRYDHSRPSPADGGGCCCCCCCCCPRDEFAIQSPILLDVDDDSRL
jgi:hypothetical protein